MLTLSPATMPTGATMVNDAHLGLLSHKLGVAIADVEAALQCARQKGDYSELINPLQTVHERVEIFTYQLPKKQQAIYQQAKEDRKQQIEQETSDS